MATDDYIKVLDQITRNKIRLSKGVIIVVAISCIGILTYKLNNANDNYSQLEIEVKEQSKISNALRKEQDTLYQERILIKREKKELNDKLFESIEENDKLRLQIKKAKQEIKPIVSRSESKTLEQAPIEKQQVADKTEIHKSDVKGKNLGNFTSTFYDLSVQSCGKSVGSKGYGLTASGVSLVGKSRSQAMSIATDPSVIPLGSKVYIEYPSSPQFNGIYVSNDTGGAIKGKIIDTFMGDFSQNATHDSVWKAGRQQVNITLLD